jgi:hypothetical protein
VISLTIVGTGHPIEERNLVEFRLLFEGLPSNGNASDKHAIRKSFHPQLRQLWSSNPNLRSLAMDQPNAGPGSSTDEDKFTRGIAEIGRVWNRAGYNIVPLVTRNMVLRCNLDIVLLRPENDLGIVKNGDIDNKLKTIFDALRIPISAAETGDEVPCADDDPLFVLLEDDQLISEVKVATDRLLMLPNERRLRSDDAHAVIHVRLNHRNARSLDNYFG